MTIDVKDLFNIPPKKKSETVKDGKSFEEKTDELVTEVLESFPDDAFQDDVPPDDAFQDDVPPEETPQDETSQEEICGDIAFLATEAANWKLKSPSGKFDWFYKEKASLISRILVDGPIPFSKYRQELKESSVDIAVPTFDTREIHQRMLNIQGIKERLKQIQIHCNSQIFLWERSVHLMHGVLARVENEKPAIKNEGIVFEHMEDMEEYYSHLRSTVKSADAVMKTLDSAQDCLSRQVTIAMPLKTVDRYAQKTESYSSLEEPQQAVPQVQQPKSVSPELSGYDGLGATQAFAVKQDRETIIKETNKIRKGSYVVGWDEI